MFEELKLKLQVAIDSITNNTLSFTEEELKAMERNNSNVVFPRFYCTFCRRVCAINAGMLTNTMYFALIINENCRQHNDEFMKYKNAEKI